jgi:hypothetical protein
MIRTGISGVVGVLTAILRRAEKGGSYTVDVSFLESFVTYYLTMEQLALNYYSQWLVSCVGTYPSPVWSQLWAKSGRRQYRHYHNVHSTLNNCLATLKKTSSDILFRNEFFEDRKCGVLGTTIRTVKPIVQYPDGEVQLEYNIGTRSNGVDDARWPDDLSAEVVEFIPEL